MIRINQDTSATVKFIEVTGRKFSGYGEKILLNPKFIESMRDKIYVSEKDDDDNTFTTGAIIITSNSDEFGYEVTETKEEILELING